MAFTGISPVVNNKITIMLLSITLYNECVKKARQSRTALLSTGPVYDVMIKV